MSRVRRVQPAIARAALLALAALTLGGCGQKGPLYLPDHNRSVVPVTPASTSTLPDPKKDIDKPAHGGP